MGDQVFDFQSAYGVPPPPLTRIPLVRFHSTRSALASLFDVSYETDPDLLAPLFPLEVFCCPLAAWVVAASCSRVGGLRAIGAWVVAPKGVILLARVGRCSQLLFWRAWVVARKSSNKARVGRCSQNGAVGRGAEEKPRVLLWLGKSARFCCCAQSISPIRASVVCGLFIYSDSALAHNQPQNLRAAVGSFETT